MVIQQGEDLAKLHREKAKEAISLAIDSRWEEAAAVNRLIVEHFPDDVEAYNRLGKALSELGRYAEAREAFGTALNLSPANAIARKNLDRLEQLKETPRRPKESRKLAPQLFIKEGSKSGVTVLQSDAPAQVLASLSAGDPVALKVSGSTLVVQDADGRELGTVEPKLASRLVRLIMGGNQYEAAIGSVGGRQVTIIIHETYRHPVLQGIPSFPASEKGPAVSEPTLSYDLEEEDGEETERELPVAWTEEEEGETAMAPTPLAEQESQDNYEDEEREAE
ncbi:MAG: tetratricopeptide repeat protein [Chloroflexi bacterium]|nr:tetratricopeptide repeat protein [Chloroflexota bacterium]